MTWWINNKLRLIQNNLRETDANLDVDMLIQELQDFNANVWMMNAGGIAAFYPSKLKYQYVTPHLKKDLLEEVITKAHKAGIRFIARFDFSKAHEKIFAQQPEWFFRMKSGKEVNYHGIVHTCLNGYYQQEYSLKIMEEVLTHYPVDGVFFNMFGYKTTDYSGNEYGICHCKNCSKRFRNMYGMALPKHVDQEDPSYQTYREFQEVTTREMLDRIHSFVKEKYPNIAICTYHHHKVDIIRKESNTALSRPHPVWIYSASENVMSSENSWEDKVISNCSINAIDLQYRFTGVSKHESKIRLYESIASGSGLDFCIIGRFEDYTDRTNFESVKQIYKFHQKNEQYFGGLKPISDAALIKPSHLAKSAFREYLGVFKMLKEQHVMFEVVEMDALMIKKEALQKVKAILLPSLPVLEQEQADLLAQLRESGVHLIGTGGTLMESPNILRRLFGLSNKGVLEATDAAYVQVNDRNLFPSLPDRDWVVISEKFNYVAFDPMKDFQSHLPLIAPSTFGPPERAYGHDLTERPGLGILDHQDDGGKSLYYPWSPGAQYLMHGFEDHKHLLIDPMNTLLREYCHLTTDAPPCVELFLHQLSDGSIMLQLLNLSGFNGVTYHEPIPIHNIQVRLRGRSYLQQAKRLLCGKEMNLTIVEEQEQWITLSIDVLNTYEAIHLYP